MNIHLNERDGKSEVGHVAEDKRGREESTDGNDVSEPPIPGHLNSVDAIEEPGGS